MSLTILNFHGVGPVTRSIDDGERNCWLDQEHFETVLDWVHDRPNVHLTVDDGNASDFEIILPALLRRGLKASFFICSGRLNQPTFLSQAQVRGLQAAGMGIGSHGVDHLPWKTLPAAQLQNELAHSKAALETLCGIPVDQAACPFGSYNRRVLASLHRIGYRTVYTSDGGSASPHQSLQARTTVTRNTPLKDTQRLIQAGPGFRTQVLISARTLIKRLR